MSSKFSIFLRIVVVVLLVDPCLSRLSIVSSSPKSGSILLADSPASLSCHTNKPWFLCVWEGPVGKACSIQEGGTTIDCHGEPRLQLLGGATSCDLKMSHVSVEDRGAWRCVLSDDQDYVTVKKNIQIEVGVQAQLQWGENVQRKQISVTEDETVEFSCVAAGGYPSPNLEWEGPDSLQIGRQVSSSADGRETIVQTVTYKGNLGDHSSKIVCRSVQTSPTGEHLFTQQVDLRLVVGALPVTDSSVAIVVGSVLSVLFIIILCLFILCFARRRKRKRKDGFEEKQLEKSGSIKTVWRGSEVGSERAFRDDIKEIEHKKLGVVQSGSQIKKEDLVLVSRPVNNEEIKRLSQDLEYLIGSSESTAVDDDNETDLDENEYVYQFNNEDEDNDGSTEADRSVGEEMEEVTSKIPMETHFENEEELDPQKSLIKHERPKSEFLEMFSQGFMEIFKAFSHTNVSMPDTNIKKKIDSEHTGQHSQPNLTQTSNYDLLGPHSQPDLRRVFHHHHHQGYHHHHFHHLTASGSQGKWKSSNSMFDCELGCFMDQKS